MIEDGDAQRLCGQHQPAGERLVGIRRRDVPVRVVVSEHQGCGSCLQCNLHHATWENGCLVHRALGHILLLNDGEIAVQADHSESLVRLGAHADDAVVDECLGVLGCETLPADLLEVACCSLFDGMKQDRSCGADIRHALQLNNGRIQGVLEGTELRDQRLGRGLHVLLARTNCSISSNAS